MPKEYQFYVLILLAGAVLGAGAMFFFSSATYGRPTSNIGDGGQESREEVVRLKDPTAPGADTIVYSNVHYGFSLRYPAGLVVKEFDEGGGSATIVFQKPGEQVGFQLYLTPHPTDTLSEATILRDVPSGVVNDLQEISLKIADGRTIPAAAFWSEAPFTGKNRELWLIHGGYLYEFTAYASVPGADLWLANIVRTIDFSL